MTQRYLFGEFTGDDLQDWGGSSFSSYIETGHEILDDLIAEKESNTIYCFFKPTEASVTSLGPPIVYDQPSSCLMRAKWHWADSSASNRWSEAKDVYRLDAHYAPASTGAYDYPFEVVQTINQVRGKGRALLLRFESSGTDDFHLLGWAVPYTAMTAA